MPGLNSVCDCCHPANVRLGTGPLPHGQAWGAGSTGQQQDKPTVHRPPELCDPSTWLNLSVPLLLLHRPGSPQSLPVMVVGRHPLPPGGSVSIAGVRATREAGVSLVGDVPLCGSWSGCWGHSDHQQTFNSGVTSGPAAPSLQALEEKTLVSHHPAGSEGSLVPKAQLGPPQREPLHEMPTRRGMSETSPS